MDSISQIALGAAVGESVLGRRVGNRAALVGAICGTLPDLDSFIPYQDAVATVTFHRSFSHSVLVLALISPLVAWLVARVYRRFATFTQWWLLVFLALVTHPLLDFFTVYGTQLLWPLVMHPYSGSTIFIIDPAYTLPLAAGVLSALAWPVASRRRRFANLLGLGVSCAYLAWTVAAKFHIEERIRMSLAEQGIAYDRMLSTPAPFNSILWRLVVMAEGGYYEAFMSVLDAPHRVDFRFYPDDKALLEPLAGHWPVQRLQWFTHGFYAARRIDDSVVIADLRMGLEPDYIFTFKVAQFRGDRPQPIPASLLALSWQSRQLAELLERTLHPIQ